MKAEQNPTMVHKNDGLGRGGKTDSGGGNELNTKIADWMEVAVNDKEGGMR